MLVAKRNLPEGQKNAKIFKTLPGAAAELKQLKRSEDETSDLLSWGFPFDQCRFFKCQKFIEFSHQQNFCSLISLDKKRLLFMQHWTTGERKKYIFILFWQIALIFTFQHLSNEKSVWCWKKNKHDFLKFPFSMYLKISY